MSRPFNQKDRYLELHVRAFNSIYASTSFIHFILRKSFEVFIQESIFFVYFGSFASSKNKT